MRTCSPRAAWPPPFPRPRESSATWIADAGDGIHPADAQQVSVPNHRCPMSADVMISYDGTPNDDDALALGKMLANAGVTLALAYVRHSREFDPRREELAQHDAEKRLERGATLLGEPQIERHVVVGASTGTTLGHLANRVGAALIVFGSDCLGHLQVTRIRAPRRSTCWRAARSQSPSPRPACARSSTEARFIRSRCRLRGRRTTSPARPPPRWRASSARRSRSLAPILST